jgi:hypothetical protein
MTELNKQQELWQTTTPGMEYDRVLGVDFYSFIKIFTNYIKIYRNSIAESK